MRIAIYGKLNSGKSTLAKYITDNFLEPYRKLSFADNVYLVAYKLFNMKEKDRTLLQNIAQKLREIDNYVFVNSTIKESLSYDNVVIDDCRFKEEFEYLKKNNFFTIKMKISDSIRKSRSPEDFEKNSKHFSENVEIDDSEFDLIITDEIQEIGYDEFNIEEVIEMIYKKKF